MARLGPARRATGMIPGGGEPDKDCHAEYASPVLKLNYPPYDPSRPRSGREVRCFDGDAGCDQDGQVNGSCSFPIDVCLFNSDPSLPGCTPQTVTTASVADRGDPELLALGAALGGLVPASSTACTTGHFLTVPLKGPNSRGVFRRGTKRVVLTASTAAGTDADKLKLTCVPREWPSHGYDPRNTRASANESTLSSANGALLEEKWTLDLQALEGGGSNGVTATPTVGDGLVYVSSWNGKIYGVKAKDGGVKWSYDTGSGGLLGSQSTPLLTADGRLIVGDSTAKVHCLKARTGQLLWGASVGNPAVDHLWSSAQIVGGRVYIGVASHSDNPCTQGRLVALDLDTGAPLWTRETVPDRVCNTDTNIACATDDDCGGAPGSCVAARGAGVTATVAIDPTGETIYMSVVGCYTFPSVGDSDSVFSLDAATGAVNWKYRTHAVEQFSDGPPYHDYGFLNGPLLIEADDGASGTRPLIVAPSKDGTLYAFNPDGTLAWTTVLVPGPEFAGFGLFDGAMGFAGHRLYSSLYTVSDAGAWPASNDHLYAFNDLGGSVAWSRQIGASWGSMAIANGLLFVGTQAAPEFYVYADTGTRLKTFTLPTNTSSGASIVNGTVYVGYGVFGPFGGVKAYGLP